MKNKTLKIGGVLFMIVLCVIYFGLNMEKINPNFVKSLEIFAPLVVFSGFFIFIVAAVLVGLSLFKIFGGSAVQ
jgi:uncharacterized membrane protein YphA (DoxX/SURF4 family)